MKLRTNLVCLVVGTIVPLFLLSIVLGILLVQRERDAFRQGAINRNRAFMAAVDEVLEGHVATLQALAATSSLEAGDFEKFRIEAVRVLKSQTDWMALEVLHTFTADVVLLDVGLPDLDGYEVARRMRLLEGGDLLKIVALTGYGQAEDQRRAFEAGFDIHLTKPVKCEKLRQVLAELHNGKVAKPV